MKKFILILVTILIVQISAFTQEIHFDNNNYKLKFSAKSPATEGYGNEYYFGNENVSNWSKMIGIYHYPKINNPLKYAENFNQTIEQTDNCVFFKLVENKSANKAVLSFLTNNTVNKKNYIEYDVYKFEKYGKSGMVVSKYASKHYFKNNSDITMIAKQIKKDNDKYLELLIISQTPTVSEAEITSN